VSELTKKMKIKAIETQLEIEQSYLDWIVGVQRDIEQKVKEAREAVQKTYAHLRQTEDT
jgi:hypothetical protein